MLGETPFSPILKPFYNNAVKLHDHWFVQLLQINQWRQWSCTAYGWKAHQSLPEWVLWSAWVSPSFPTETDGNPHPWITSMTGKFLPSRRTSFYLTDPCSSATYAKFTQHDFSPIFHSPTCFEKLPTNARHQRQIGARSREWQSLSVNYQRRDLRESPMRRRHSKIFVMLNIWSCRRFTILLCVHRWSLYERAKYRATGSSDDFFFSFTKPFTNNVPTFWH